MNKSSYIHFQWCIFSKPALENPNRKDPIKTKLMFQSTSIAPLHSVQKASADGAPNLNHIRNQNPGYWSGQMDEHFA